MFYYFNAEMKYREKLPIYGVEWDGSSSTSLTRTDASANFADPNPYYSGMSDTPSSPFDNIMPWSGMVVSEDNDAGTVVAIPKFYFKLDYANPESATKGLKIQISMEKHRGFQCSPAHMDRGDGNGERDVVYVGRYACASDYKSKTGVTAGGNMTFSSASSGIHNLGSNVWLMDYATVITIQMLYLVEYANWDSQACVGYGGSSDGRHNMGSTDNIAYHTGTTQTSRTLYGSTKYRNIEDLWGNIYTVLGGIRCSGSNVYMMKDPADFSNTTGGTLVGTRLTNGGYIKAYKILTAEGYTWAMLPSSAADNAIGSYITDYYSYQANSVNAYIGDNASEGQGKGIMYLLFYGDANNVSANTGARLMILP